MKPHFRSLLADAGFVFFGEDEGTQARDANIIDWSTNYTLEMNKFLEYVEEHYEGQLKETYLEEPNYVTVDRFDLEQEIMNCWHVTEDIQTLYESPDFLELDENEIANYLLGLKTIYGVKFEKLWNVFEKLIKQKSFVKQQKNTVK